MLGFPMPKIYVSIFLGLLSSFWVDQSAADQTAQSFKKEETRPLELNYLLSLPEGYEDDKKEKWPLVVFLHGSGERGTNLESVKVHGPPKLVANGKSFPFIVVSPQCPLNHWWDSLPVLELVDDIEKRYRIDSDRIYLTGLSMGGYGTWHFAMKAPHRFAAIAPICGGGILMKLRFIPQLPVWAFHGAQDRSVPVSESTRLMTGLKTMGNERSRLSIIPEAGHDCWTEAYNKPELYEWMLSNSLPKEESKQE